MTLRSPCKPAKQGNTEVPIALELWLRDGFAKNGSTRDGFFTSKSLRWPLVSVGRTDSKRRVGFAVKMKPRGAWILFTLNRVQVANLRDHLTYQLGRLKK